MTKMDQLARQRTETPSYSVSLYLFLSANPSWNALSVPCGIPKFAKFLTKFYKFNVNFKSIGCFLSRALTHYGVYATF